MTDRPGVAPGTVVLYGDVACPWASLAVHRLWTARRDLGLDDAVRFDLRCFPLELVNARATPKRTLDAELPVIAALAPELGWQPWQRADWEYAVTSLPAMAAVQAAKAEEAGGLAASEALDLALRHAFYAESRPISLHTEVVAVARECDRVDADVLVPLLESGAGRAAVFAQQREAQRVGVQGSPHLYLPDGGDVHNPGVEFSWTTEPGTGFPVVTSDDPAVYRDLLRRAAG